MENTTASTTNTTVMSAQEFKQKSYDAYLAYVSFIEGQKSIADTVEALSPLMLAYGFTLTVDNLANRLTVKMTTFGKDKGEQAKKVKSISTFRAFVKGGWEVVDAAPIHYHAGNNPATTKSNDTTKAEGLTNAELEENNAALLAEPEAPYAVVASEEEKVA